MKAGTKRIAGLLVLAYGGVGAAVARAQENVDPLAEIELPDASERDPSEPGGEASEAESFEPWTGTYAEGMAEVVRLAANESHGAALELTERLLAPDRYARLRARLEESLGPRGASWLAPLDAPFAWIGLESLDDRSRAEVRYVRGLLCARTGAVLRADEELGLARALAGPGATRNDAVYALGTLDLLLAEELRRRIPEISGAAPVAPPGPGATPPGDEEEPDPLELARAAYEEARAHLVERLRLDWRDENTRANTELVQRRLRELDEIERQREEEQQDSQEQEPQEGDPQDQESEESEEQESEDQESEPQDSDSEEEGSEQQESEDEESEESEDAESEEESEDAEQEPEAELEERILTQEEMMRLLEEFQRYQEQGVELREQNRRVRREKVDKDW